jgi:hypothetical protein
VPDVILLGVIDEGRTEPPPVSVPTRLISPDVVKAVPVTIPVVEFQVTAA